VTTHTIKKGEEEEAEEEEKEEQIVLPEKGSVGDHAITFIEKDFKRKEVSWCSCVPCVHSTCCAKKLCEALWLQRIGNVQACCKHQPTAMSTRATA
jgi:hypothetical protein